MGTTLGSTGITFNDATTQTTAFTGGKGTQVITSTQSFTVPTGVTSIWVTLVGGGGGGQSITYPTQAQGAGGGAGGAGTKLVTGLTPGQVITCTIGGGGGAGGTGGTTSFGAYFSATGGGGSGGANGTASGSVTKPFGQNPVYANDYPSNGGGRYIVGMGTAGNGLPGTGYGNNGSNATGYGAGGGGAAGWGWTVTGGSGSPGYMYLEW